jgi:hypothetical protein
MKMDMKTVCATFLFFLVLQRMTKKKEKESMCGMCGGV